MKSISTHKATTKGTPEPSAGASAGSGAGTGAWSSVRPIVVPVSGRQEGSRRVRSGKICYFLMQAHRNRVCMHSRHDSQEEALCVSLPSAYVNRSQSWQQLSSNKCSAQRIQHSTGSFDCSDLGKQVHHLLR